MTTRKKISLAAMAVAWLAPAALLTQVTMAQKRKAAAEPYAIVGGQVFREPGYALPEAKIVIELKDAGAQSEEVGDLQFAAR
jgi:hypothetical protein